MYSGYSTNNELDNALKKSIRNDTKDFTIFPSDPPNFKSKYVTALVDYFSKIGFDKFNVCIFTESKDKEKELSNELHHINFISKERALESSTIFLSGGNNYTFLDHLRRTNMDRELMRYANEGGRLVGMSTGSMLMNPDIEHTAIPDYDIEENVVGLSNLSALNLVDFYVFPHFDDNKSYTKQATKFVKDKNPTGYLLKDNQGIHIENGSIKLFGDPEIIH